MEAIGARHIGARVTRVEDARILTGKGRYIDDIVLPGMLHAAFLRSQVPHGRLNSVDASEARELPGVVAVYTGEEIQRISNAVQAAAVSGMNMMPGMNLPTVFPLATDKVRYVGDPIAVVIAESRYIAEDALELIIEDVDPIDGVVTYEDALDESKPLIFEELGTNINLTADLALGDVEAAFAAADRVVQTTVDVHRHQPVPMECRGLVAIWDASREHMTIHSSTQSPHMMRMLLPPQIDVPMENIRVLAGDVGGGFGLKNGVSREEVAIVAAAKDQGRPIKWAEDRMEHLAAAGQAREEMADIEAAVTNEGRVLGVRMQVKVNAGAYPGDPFPGSMQAYSIPGLFQGPLKLEGLSCHSTAVFSNKATYVAYRGPWATADFLRERLLDIVAHELGIDPLDVRRVNYVVRDEPPLTLLDGRPYVGVTTRETVEQAADTLDWAGFRKRQAKAREEGRYLGIGMASYIEAAPGPKAPGQTGPDIMGYETANLAVDADGTLLIYTRQQPHGQGHETTLAQVAADEFGIPFENIRVVFGDTDVTPVAMIGTGGSRAATMANGAVLHGSRALKAKVLALAADQLEASPADLELVDGVVSVKGSPSITLTLAELAARVPAEELTASHTYDGGQPGWSGGTHCCIVDVDVDTGMVHIERYVVIEDCGVPVNPAIVEGQVRGGVTQGIGAVLLEHAAYDEGGQYLAGTFMDYLLPVPSLVPNIEIHHVETIDTDPDVNFRGVGEGGMIVAPAALTNAIEDALLPFGITVQEQHLPPARIRQLAGGA